MITIKNTQNHEISIIYNEAEIIVPAFGTMKLNEMLLGKLPLGIESITEERILTEIDPYTDKTISETPVDTTQLLNEEFKGLL